MLTYAERPHALPVMTGLLLCLLSALCQAGSTAIRPILSVQSAQQRDVLSLVSKPFEDSEEQLRRLTRDMEASMHAAGGDGIAAIQIGLPLRVFLLKRYDQPGEPLQTFVNPEVLHASEALERTWDGCLSIPEGVGRVSRPARIEVRYRDEHGNWLTETLTGRTGVIFQHEMDHLNGRLFTHLIPDARLLPLSEYFDLYDEIEIHCEDRHFSAEECEGWADQQWHSRQP